LSSPPANVTGKTPGDTAPPPSGGAENDLATDDELPLQRVCRNLQMEDDMRNSVSAIAPSLRTKE
jgi:hypothetical protein